MQALNKDIIAHELQQNGWNKPYDLYLFDSIDSTNRYLKELEPTSTLVLCCAESQTQGRGRFGRSWHSPFGENIYCSVRWPINGDVTKLSGLSLVTSLAVLATLTPLNQKQELKIKWPNDILWHDKKLCGSLIELSTTPHCKQTYVIIGIGLNVNSDTQHQPLPDKSWCSLFEITQHLHDRNQLIAALLIHLEQYIQRVMQHGLHVFLDEWAKYDYLQGKEITLTQANQTLTGKACGINESGQLILCDHEGKQHVLSAGDTTLNAKK